MSRRNVAVFASVWFLTPPMATPRHYSSSALLEDGKVLVVGGLSGMSAVSSAELYDPKTNTWSSAGSMAYPRGQFSAVPIALGVHAGQIVVAGGTLAGNKCELYDPKTNAWKLIAPMKTAKPLVTVVSTSSWVIAISGASVERWNSYDDTWADVPAPTGNPYTISAVATNDGRIFALHGLKDTSSGVCSGTVELLDPATWTWSAGAPLVPARCASIVRLKDGRIAAMGGASGGSMYADVDLYDPATNSWTKSTPMPVDHGRPVLLSSGKVLLAAGYLAGAPSDLAHLFDPATGTWTTATKLSTPRQLTSVTALLNGGALAAGGTVGGASLSSAELFDETGKTCATDGDCPAHACVDGVCCDRKCDGQCEACDVKGSVGTCTAVTGAPHGTRAACPGGAPSCNESTYSPGGQCQAGACVTSMPKSCGAFACDAAKGCLTECTANVDCANGLICKARACVKGCSQDLGSAIASDGSDVACGFYLCNPAEGKCRESCSETSHCAPGLVCDATSKCVSGAGSDDSGGCAFGRRESSATFLLGLAAIFLARRRRMISRKSEN